MYNHFIRALKLFYILANYYLLKFKKIKLINIPLNNIKNFSIIISTSLLIKYQ